jgi:histidinol phosphatase-like enzyme
VKTVCFDLDGVLCTKTDGDYENAQPDARAIAVVNRLRAEGYHIIINTSRFMGRNNGDALAATRDGYDFTHRQLLDWGVQFDELHMGKPVYDKLVDDRAVFFADDWDRIYQALVAE